MAGKVWLVGAGPGDIGLMTLKGYEVLSQAEVVVYDSLISPALLAMLPEDAEKIDAGKRAGNHKLRQEETNQLLLEEALKGKKVVRLKGGDPFLFGRGGEELALLQEHQIPYEVVPGITSAISVPAYNGIPVTHRDFCSSVHIITGHKKKGEAYDIDFEALVRTGGTLIFLMGITALKDICDNLIQAGMDKDMPAAVLQEGTTANQRRVVATVETLFDRATKEGIGTPGIIVVGNVCDLSRDYNWYEKLPLFGCRVVVTRPKDLSVGFASKLRTLGAEVIELPAIRIAPFDENERLKKALFHIKEYQWIVFTSPSGVRVFFEQLRNFRQDVRALGHLKIGAIGKGTEKELNTYGFYADVIPKVYDGASLGRAIAKEARPGEKILLPRAAIGNQEILDELAAFDVEDIPIYDTILEKNDTFSLEQEAESLHCIAFTSSSSVHAFVKAYPDILKLKVTAVCIGEKTMQSAKSYGLQCFVAKQATIDSMVEAICEIKR